MIFQTLDSKNECVAVYCNEELHYDEMPNGLTATWGYAPYLDRSEVEFASLYCHDKTIDDLCPEALRPHWDQAVTRLKAFYQCFRESKIDLNENCFFDLVGEDFLMQYCDIKCKITEHVLSTCEKPENYEFLVGLSEVLGDIRTRRLNVNPSNLRDMMAKPKARRFIKKLSEIRPYASYNMAGTKTGRLTTKPHSFPVLTLDKDLRAILAPNNDLFVELDFNAAELRTVLALSGQEQPDEDIHMWIMKEVYGQQMSRDEIKKKTFAWLYNPEASNPELESVFDRKGIVERYYQEGHVSTPFGREIEVDEFRAFNYIVQSTTSDLFLRQMIKIYDAIRDKKSYIAFSVHDSLLLDFAAEDKGALKDIVSVFSDTEMGAFKTNVSVGKDYQNMRKLAV